MTRRESALRQSWDANAAAWTSAVRSGQIESRALGTDRAILEAVLETNPRSVLDVGCGEGWLCRSLTARGVSAIGVDGSAELVEEAKRAGGGVFHVLDYADLAEGGEIPGGGLHDAIALNFALLGDDHTAHLRALTGHLSPGGRIVLQTVHPWTARHDQPYRCGWRMETFAAFGSAFRTAMPWYYRTVERWVEEFHDAGFCIVALREPRHPETSEPLSLLLIAQPLPHPGRDADPTPPDHRIRGV
jgi:2-polyprenyl-3-methyl-5-hydroxy-6-metoxy-1,4-benzoquinol methylase